MSLRSYFYPTSNPIKIALSLIMLMNAWAYAFPTPQIRFAPEAYVCCKTAEPVIVDGQLDDPAWKNASWTDYFTDIEGDLKPAPRFKTRVKMLWDNDYFYIAAEIEEPDVWAVLVERDAVIFYDNDFEVFIDPDGDTHEYYELELNALNTVWDLFLVKPYRDGGPALHAWDITGLKTATRVQGTINKPGDQDLGWTVEIAFPWKILKEASHRPAPPNPADVWRVNFSRVEWKVDAAAGKYIKRFDPETGKTLPEDNWVWSAQGLVNMHYPEMWGFVKFSVEQPGMDSFTLSADDMTRWNLRQVYYRERDIYEQGGSVYTENPDELYLPPFKGLHIKTAAGWFEAYLPASDGFHWIFIDAEGRTRTGGY